MRKETVKKTMFIKFLRWLIALGSPPVKEKRWEELTENEKVFIGTILIEKLIQDYQKEIRK